ncbi:transcription elongation factor SPT5-like [Schistocerca gregaria]|uniref:transcription elongation factor SPT5-like n=1 Tax=Schistocerca gregaria TaxID=7010 RepID=UPI00211F0499|nr:transcription elongation factor SPT5-like [Schistocerca gregaria]XP_049848778.1 transcription elongation factor SPT5-like [Schistocerca gregaria]
MVREEVDGENQTWVYWNGQAFMNGFLYKKVKMNCLSMEEAQPTMNEILLFSAASKKTLEEFKVMEEMLSIPSKGTQKMQFVKGDNVEVVRGELISVIGKVQSTDGDRVVFVPSDTKLYGSDPLVVPVQYLRKYFKSGDRIKVLNGIHEGETGLVTSVSGEVATVFSDSSQKNFKVLMKDIQETMETNLGKLGLGKYELHDLVQVNDQSVGMIVKVNSDGFDILNWHGQLKTVQLHDVGMKRNIRNVTYHDSIGKLVSLGDTVRVAVGPHSGQTGTVAHMYQNVAWIRCREHKENGGIITVKCMQMSLVSKNNTDSFYRSSFGNQAPRSSSRMASGNNNRYRITSMRRVYITKGIWKGYSGVVRNENKTSVRIELDAGEKVVTLPLDFICSAQELEERTPSYRDQFLNADVSRKDDGSQTPMRMATPRHSATSYCQSDPWNPNMKPTLPSQFGMIEGMGNSVTTPFTPGAAGIDVSLKPPSSNNYAPSNHMLPPTTPFTPFSHVTTPCTPGTNLLSSDTNHGSDQATTLPSHEPLIKSYPSAPLTPSIHTEPPKEEGPHDWICPDIEVLISSEPYIDTHGIVKEIDDETCQVQLLPPASNFSSDPQKENSTQLPIVTVRKEHLSLVPPSKRDQIIVIKGPLKGSIGNLVGINKQDALISQCLNSFVSQITELARYHGVQS